jgi:hypothetical protein
MGSQLLLVVAFLVVVMIAVIVWQQYGKQRRVKEMRAGAAALGYQFAEEHAGLLETLHGLASFTEIGPHTRQTTNVMRSEADGAAVTVFDYSYWLGQGKNRRFVRQSVLLLESERLDLPAFALRPEGLTEKLQGALGQPDIDFEAQPAFSAAYVLQGADETRIRILFDSEKLAFFAQRRGLRVEGNGRQLLYYRAGKLVSPKAIPSFIEEGRAVLRLLAGG